MVGKVSGKVVLKDGWSLIKVVFHEDFHSITVVVAGFVLFLFACLFIRAFV